MNDKQMQPDTAAAAAAAVQPVSTSPPVDAADDATAPSLQEAEQTVR